MGYTYPSPVTIMVYSVKHRLLLVAYESGDLQAWDPYLHRVVYHIEDPILMKGKSQNPKKYPISCITVKDEKDRFFISGTNGSVQIRYTSSGRLLTELFIKDVKNKQALQGLFKISFTEEINGQIYVGANHPHIIQFDTQLFNHRYEWTQTVSPLIYGMSLEPNLLMTVHSNGDLIYWRLAYKKSWLALNMLTQGPDIGSKGSRYTANDKERIPAPSRSSKRTEQSENMSDISLQSRGSGIPSTSMREVSTSISHESARGTFSNLERSSGTDSNNIVQKNLLSKTKEKYDKSRANFKKEQRGSKSSMTSENEDARQNTIDTKPEYRKDGHFDIKAFIFLKKNRPIFNKKIGNLLLIQSKSQFIQCWNAYGFISQFPVTNNICWLGVTSCAVVDPEERFLFLGSERGFVRTYYIENYQNPNQDERLSRVQLRALFPFLLTSLHKSVADRKTDGSLEVPLVNNYRAHIEAIICMEFLPGKQLLVTAGKDKVVRIWHFSGLFMGQLGASADACRLSGKDMDLFEVPPPPYFLPTFMAKYTEGVSIGQRKVMLRDWRNPNQKMNMHNLMEMIKSNVKDDDAVKVKELKLEEYIELQDKRSVRSSSSSSSSDSVF